MSILCGISNKRMITKTSPSFAGAGTILLLVCINATVAGGGAAGWTTKHDRKNDIKAEYLISDRIDGNGERVPLIRYRLSSRRNLTLRECVDLMKDVSRHKDFQGDDQSRILKALSDDEWLLYYYTKGLGPIPDADCVARMSIMVNEGKGEAVFTIVADPDRYKMMGAKRFTHYHVSYTFRDAGTDSVMINVDAEMSPTQKVPQWMLNAAFPDAAFDIIRNFDKLAKAG